MRTIQIIISISCLFPFSIISINAQSSDKQIFEFLDGRKEIVRLEHIKPRDHFRQAFKCRIVQPIDHKNHRAGYFEQLLYIKHVDFKAPIVLVTEGYAARNRTHEISEILRANQVEIEYRFHGTSKPVDETIPWEFLITEQANRDLHRIRKMLKKFYKGKWVSTGISKGGTTAILYKRDYPGDVKLTIPYVAPLAQTPSDPRTDKHLNTVGSDDCRAQIASCQKAILMKRDSLIHLLEEWSDRSDKIFSTGIEGALEYAVLELPFSFWQYGWACKSIPDIQSSAKTFFSYLNDVVGFDVYSKTSYEIYQPAFYQFMTELGYYSYPHEHLGSLIKVVRPDNKAFAPKNVDLTYDGSKANDVLKWLDRRGKRMIYIYGGHDPWTACGIVPSKKSKSLRFDDPDGDHRTRMIHLSGKQRREMYDYIKKNLKTELYPLRAIN